MKYRLSRKDFTRNRCYFGEDIIQAKPISQMHVINLNMNCIHSIEPGSTEGREPKRINHENTKFGKHEIFLFFRVFIVSCFRDEKVFHKMQRIHN